MNKKSVVIVGKGTSVLKSTEKYMSQFDEIAFCNFPPITGYEKYIGSKCDWMFANMWDPNLYEDDVFKKLNLKHLVNTHPNPKDDCISLTQKYGGTYVSDYGQKNIPLFKNNFGFDPSTGIQAYYYFVQQEEYDTIGLVGFDNFKVGEKAYYYSVDEVQHSLRYLYSDGDTAYTKDGIRKEESKHGTTKNVDKYISDMGKLFNVKIKGP
mgnify:CR=1 FL=1